VHAAPDDESEGGDSTGDDNLMSKSRNDDDVAAMNPSDLRTTTMKSVTMKNQLR
jgi:hypothetical protein